MRRVERSLAHHEHKLAPLLQVDVGRAHDQVVVQRVRDPGHRADAAGRDEHAGGLERATRDSRGKVVLLVLHVRERQDVGDLAVGLVLDRRARALRHDRVDLDRWIRAQRLKGPDAVDGA